MQNPVLSDWVRWHLRHPQDIKKKKYIRPICLSHAPISVPLKTLSSHKALSNNQAEAKKLRILAGKIVNVSLGCSKRQIQSRVPPTPGFLSDFLHRD